MTPFRRNPVVQLDVELNGIKKSVQVRLGTTKISLSFQGVRGKNTMKFHLSSKKAGKGRVQTTLAMFKIGKQ
jgi:hypothetical protein